VSTVANWFVAFVGRGRRQRTITAQEVFARTRELGAREPAPATGAAADLERTGAR
jgi:hypothetical protein